MQPTLEGSATSLPTPGTWTCFAPLHLMFGSSQEMLIFVCVTSFGMVNMAYLSSLDMVVAGNYSSPLKCDADFKKIVFWVSKLGHVLIEQGLSLRLLAWSFYWFREVTLESQPCPHTVSWLYWVGDHKLLEPITWYALFRLPVLRPGDLSYQFIPLISPYLLLQKPKQLADHFFSAQVHIPLWLGSCPGPNCSRLKELQAAILVAIVPAEALYVSQDLANSKTQRDNCCCSVVPLEFQLSSNAVVKCPITKEC